MLERIVFKYISLCHGYEPLLDDIVEDLHHGNGLLIRKALILQPLDKLERIKVMLAVLPRSRMESSSQGWRLATIAPPRQEACVESRH